VNASQSGVRESVLTVKTQKYRVNTVPSLLITGEPRISKKGVSTIPKGSRMDNCHHPKRGGSHNINGDDIMGYIYKITNTLNGKIYIGQTVKSL
jgi:hypothetical protein